MNQFLHCLSQERNLPYISRKYNVRKSGKMAFPAGSPHGNSRKDLSGNLGSSHTKTFDTHLTGCNSTLAMINLGLTCSLYTKFHIARPVLQ